MSPSESGLGGVGGEPGAQPGCGSGWMRVGICICDLKSFRGTCGETGGAVLSSGAAPLLSVVLSLPVVEEGSWFIKQLLSEKAWDCDVQLRAPGPE